MIWVALVACTAWASAAALEIGSKPVAADCTSGQASGPVLLRQGELYQATVKIGDWSGNFSRYALSPEAGGVGASTTLSWDAGAILNGTPPGQRKIYTATVQPNGALEMTPFAWLSLSAAQQALLDLDDEAGEKRLAYLRGDRTLEGTLFRRRSSVLGDSVHSTPVYSGQVDRRAAVYLGANDGMLHAFDATTGVELFAYVPDALFAQLHHLASPAYQHRAYVDGLASVNQKGLLVSGMGGGAKGVFALDVADPARFVLGRGVLWEFGEHNDSLMGNVISLPQIARVRVRSDVERQFAIVAGGMNAEAGALFLLSLDKPRDEGWQRNSNYYRIETKEPAALSAPVLLNDGEGRVRYAYAGDLQGNLWRFDLSVTPWSADKLFTARDASGRAQPITEQPLLAYAQTGGYLILFGTGQLIEAADRSSNAKQSYYAIIDVLPDKVSGRSQLTQRFLDGQDLPMEPASKGWFIDFSQPSERSLHAGVLADGAVLFNTVLPGADMCSPTHSRSYVLNVLTGLPDDGIFTARLPNGETIAGAMLPDYAPVPLLLPQSTTISTRDAQGKISQEKDYAVVQVTGEGRLAVTGSLKTRRRVGRLSWREIANWRELHEAAK
ncbi:PQQ-binding-like beta-propeller repeat protein [Duganella sp. sic0402]|nr:PQQ-binding-like beta-propeller repeat protein [Duganella sp. sic0402]